MFFPEISCSIINLHVVRTKLGFDVPPMLLGISYRCDIRSRTELTANVCSDMIETLVRAKGHCYSAGGWPSSSKGGDAYADYSDIPCVRFHLHIKNYEKKQQPPLCQVTVV